MFVAADSVQNRVNVRAVALLGELTTPEATGQNWCSLIKNFVTITTSPWKAKPKKN
jgi:hypothetical protein